MAMKTVMPPERFLRGQRRANRGPRRLSRSTFRRLAILLALLTLVGVGIWTAAAAGRAPELMVNRIWVEGNERLSDGEILELLELDEQAYILSLDLEQLRQKLLRSAWVSEVELTRVLPATLTLHITERLPVGIAVLDELYLLAADGVILDQLGAHHNSVNDLLVIRGIGSDERPGASVGSGGGVARGRAELAGRIASSIVAEPNLSRTVSELDVTSGPDSVRLHLRRPEITMLVSEESLPDRLLDVVPLLEDIMKVYPALELVDLRFRGRIYLRLHQPTPAEARVSDEIPGGGASF